MDEKLQQHFDDIYQGDMKGWGVSYRNSQLYRYRLSMRMIQSQTGGGHALEIACGTGEFTSPFLTSAFGENVTGIDISSVAIERAKKRNPNLMFLQDSLPNLARVHQKFSLITAMECLYYLPQADRVKSIDRIADLCEDGGRFFLSVNIGPAPYFSKEEIRTLVGRRFRILEERDFCFRGYYRWIEVPLVRCVEWTGAAFWKQARHPQTRKRYLAYRFLQALLDNVVARKTYRPLLHAFAKGLLRHSPVAFFDWMGHRISAEKNITVLMMIAEKR